MNRTVIVIALVVVAFSRILIGYAGDSTFQYLHKGYSVEQYKYNSDAGTLKFYHKMSFWDFRVQWCHESPKTCPFDPKDKDIERNIEKWKNLRNLVLSNPNLPAKKKNEVVAVANRRLKELARLQSIAAKSSPLGKKLVEAMDDPKPKDLWDYQQLGDSKALKVVVLWHKILKNHKELSTKTSPSFR